MGAYKNITKRILIENRVKGLLEKYGNLGYQGMIERLDVLNEFNAIDSVIEDEFKIKNTRGKNIK